MFVFYLGYLISLWGWTYFSLVESHSELTKLYVAAFALVTILGGIACLCWRNKKDVRKGVMIGLALMALGLSIAFRAGKVELEGYVKDTFIMIIVFLFVYLLLKYTRLYKIKFLNMLVVSCLPFVLIGARLFGKKTGGSYIYFCGLLIFGLVLMGYPFVVSYFMSLPENKYREGNVKNLSLNVLSFLLYTLLLFTGCALCNEFGLLLILGITATGIFFVRCKNMITKLLYTSSCLIGVVIACRFIPHVRDRVIIWLNPSEAAQNAGLAEKAETVLYLFRNFKRIGWYGNGISNLSSKIYTTFNSDHVTVTLMNDYGIFIAFLTLGIGILLICWMFREVSGLDNYDKYLLLSGGLIVSSIVVIHVGSNLGSFITAGIGFPFVSDGGTVNLMLTTLIATRCAILERMVSRDAVY